MNRSDQEIYALESWREIKQLIPEPLRKEIPLLLFPHIATLVEKFYETLINDDKARAFLKLEIVNQRLKITLRQWLEQMLLLTDDDSFVAFAARQIEVGSIHARIKLPYITMQVGFRILTLQIRRILKHSSLQTNDVLAAQIYFTDLLNLSDSLMLGAYLSDIQYLTRADEAYRANALKLDLSLERERQRAALLDWNNKLLYSSRFGISKPIHHNLAESEFGLWLNHKAKALFENMQDMMVVQDVVEHIDHVILPQLHCLQKDESENLRLFEELRNKLDLVRYLMNDLFDRLAQIDNGRDSITGLYNRQHLGAIMSRELEHHASTQQSFGAILIKINNLDSIVHSLESKQTLLRQISTLLIEFSRTSDYVFRYGNSEFLMLAIESTAEQNYQLAHEFQKKLVSHQFFLRGNSQLKLNVSIGVANHDGHPDYMRLLLRAENALIKASVQGGNDIVMLDTFQLA